MSDIVYLDRSKTVGEIVDEANDLPAVRLRPSMVRAAKAVSEFNLGTAPTSEELRQLVTLGALVNRYLFGLGNVPRNRNARL